MSDNDIEIIKQNQVAIFTLVSEILREKHGKKPKAKILVKDGVLILEAPDDSVIY